ncbi:MAG: hypothetical protein JW839_15950 [Candidatus Lokiarchaeota archaeon]|nr:hypothetical protein [Candidatus Lokiarchaeota archaeon]
MTLLEERLRVLGLTPDEAACYIHLLKVKAATVREIHAVPPFKEKKRPNVYKIVDGLLAKGLLDSEVKEGKQRLFPVRPHVVLEEFVERKNWELEELRASMPALVENLERVFDTPPTVGFTIPAAARPLTDLMNPAWIVREAPEVFQEQGIGVVHSVEFNTRRRFGGDSAGLSVHEFKYTEHVAPAFGRARDFAAAHFESAMRSIKPHGPVHVKAFSFHPASLDRTGKMPRSLEYTRIETRLSIPGRFTGGMCTFAIEELPVLVVTAWGADARDFMDAMQRLAHGFTLVQPGTAGDVRAA